MNLSTPILIGDEHEEIRLLVKDMLTKHGYFHLLEANTTEEVLQQLSENHFLFIHKKLLDSRVKKALIGRSNFLIVAQSDDAETLTLAAYFGVKHLISFPYTANSLIEIINELA